MPFHRVDRSKLEKISDRYPYHLQHYVDGDQSRNKESRPIGYRTSIISPCRSEEAAAVRNQKFHPCKRIDDDRLPDRIMKAQRTRRRLLRLSRSMVTWIAILTVRDPRGSPMAVRIGERSYVRKGYLPRLARSRFGFVPISSGDTQGKYEAKGRKRSRPVAL